MSSVCGGSVTESGWLFDFWGSNTGIAWSGGLLIWKGWCHPGTQDCAICDPQVERGAQGMPTQVSVASIWAVSGHCPWAWPGLHPQALWGTGDGRLAAGCRGAKAGDLGGEKAPFYGYWHPTCTSPGCQPKPPTWWNGFRVASQHPKAREQLHG